ncbi:MAG: hypothetical protein LBV09_03135 [Deferribacteraceae bacterium]|jgi:hypothetical protein|nr:hypothetical protein [Deferribacteraceae bacterium]
MIKVAKVESLPTELLHDTEPYNEWFCAKVNEALHSTKPLIPHEQAMDDIQKIIDRKRNND